jgi:hypothetical protein
MGRKFPRKIIADATTITVATITIIKIKRRPIPLRSLINTNKAIS